MLRTSLSQAQAIDGKRPTLQMNVSWDISFRPFFEGRCSAARPAEAQRGEKGTVPSESASFEQGYGGAPGGVDTLPIASPPSESDLAHYISSIRPYDDNCRYYKYLRARRTTTSSRRFSYRHDEGANSLSLEGEAGRRRRG